MLAALTMVLAGLATFTGPPDPATWRKGPGYLVRHWAFFAA